MYHSFQNKNGYFYILTNYSENLYYFLIQRNKYPIIKLCLHILECNYTISVYDVSHADISQSDVSEVVIMNTKAKKYIPLTEATYYILLSLVKPMHGYGIMQMVEEMTNGEVKLGPGTLYGNTTKLLKEKLIVEVASTDRKKCYELTPFGREVLELEYNRLQRSVKNGNSILGE